MEIHYPNYEGEREVLFTMQSQHRHMMHGHSTKAQCSCAAQWVRGVFDVRDVGLFWRCPTECKLLLWCHAQGAGKPLAASAAIRVTSLDSNVQVL